MARKEGAGEQKEGEREREREREREDMKRKSDSRFPRPPFSSSSISFLFVSPALFRDSFRFICHTIVPSSRDGP
jgi:hypothetical protein